MATSYNKHAGIWLRCFVPLLRLLLCLNFRYLLYVMHHSF